VGVGWRRRYERGPYIINLGILDTRTGTVVPRNDIGRVMRVFKTREVVHISTAGEADVIVATLISECLTASILIDLHILIDEDVAVHSFPGVGLNACFRVKY
jgi:hypothetical protein